MFRAGCGWVLAHDLVVPHGEASAAGVSREEDPVISAAVGRCVSDGAIRGLPVRTPALYLVSKLDVRETDFFFFIGEGIFLGSHGGRRQQVARGQINVLFLVKINIKCKK